MDGIGFSDREFFEEQEAADRRWLLPVNLAVAVHIAVFVGALYLPGIIKHRPLLDEVVTVDLVSLPEPAPPTPARPKPVQEAKPVQPKPPPPAPKPPPEPAAVAVAPEPQVAPKPAAPARPISLRPLKRKIRKARDTRLAEEKERERLARERRQRELARQRALAQAREAERKAEEARRRAVAELAALIRTSNAVGTPSRRRSSAGKQVRSIALKQYVSALYDRVQSFWILPEMRRWDPRLEAVVVLTIRRDGTVVRTTMEKRSQDPFFDQQVMKTIQSASPMPRFSKLMPQDTIEVGLRFRPGQLSM